MSTSRDIRRLAFQALFQLDANSGTGAEAIRSGLAIEHTADMTAEEINEAMALAQGAWSDRAFADRAMVKLAPTWPAYRQAAVDRAILRLAHYDMIKGPGAAKPKVVVNDAVELAKEFSTEKSPGFVNALLDKVLKEVLGAKDVSPVDEAKPTDAE